MAGASGLLLRSKGYLFNGYFYDESFLLLAHGIDMADAGYARMG